MADLPKLGCLTQNIESSDELIINEFVEKLRGVCGCATLEFALSAGRLVVDTFYGGDLTLWRTHRKNHPSLRRLARRQDLPISVSQLYRCVAIYEVSHGLPDLSTWKHLGASHVRAVLRLPQEDQRRLLASGEQEHWTVERIEHEVRMLQGDVRSHRGRPPLSERSSQLSCIRRWLDDCPESLSPIESYRIDAQTRAALQAGVLAVRERCDKLEEALRLPVTDVANTKSRLTSTK